MKFIYNLMRAWRIATTELKFSEIYDQPTVWTDEDADATRAFFGSDTGKKLSQRLVNTVFKANAAACESPENIKFNGGIARGVALTVNALQEHFRFRAHPTQWGNSDAAKR